MIANESDMEITIQPLSIIAELSMSPTILTHTVVPEQNRSNQLKAEEIDLEFDFGNSPIPQTGSSELSPNINRFLRSDHVKHHIHLHNDTPIKHRARPIHPCVIEAVREHLRDLLEAGVVLESESPFSSPIVVRMEI